jgi:PhnB protein
MINPTSLTPWLSVQKGAKAAEFYKSAFGAAETYRLQTPDGGLVARLSVSGAEFWISEIDDPGVQPLGGGSIRIILTVENPDNVFAQAVRAGATQVFPVAESHG